jgi:CheY-like chemotaxis protein
VAEDGHKGIEAALRERPDLIPMDLSLPVLSGWEAAQQLKQSAQTQAIPIIALSAHALEGERNKALSAGCDEFERPTSRSHRRPGRPILKTPLASRGQWASARRPAHDRPATSRGKQGESPSVPQARNPRSKP